MKTSVRFAHSAICFCQSVLVLIATSGPVLAANSSASAITAQSETARLDAFERTVFGEPHKNASVESRLRELEVNLFGKAKSGSTADRLAAVQKSLGGTNTNLLMPAMAPQLDTSSTADGATGTPQAAPGAVASAAPEPASRSDAGKEELHQAMALYQQGDLPQAEKAFHRVLAIDPRNSDAYYNLGVIAEGHGDLQTALSNYQAAYNVNPNDSDLRSAVSAVQNKIADKIAADRRSREQDQVAQKQAQEQQQRSNLKQLTADASTSFKAGNFDKAIYDLQNVARQAPNDADVQYALAQAYRGKNELPQAREAIARAVSLNPSNQLYKDTLSQLSEQIAQGGSSSNAPDGAPPSAPDYRNGGGSQTAYDRSGSSASSSPDAQLTGSAQDNSTTTGQLTPFSDSSQRSVMPAQRGYALGGGAMGGGYGSSYGGGGLNYRLHRAAVTGATGAAMGAVMSSMFSSPGYRGRAAMRGALFGGAMGLLTGGLLSH